MIERRRNDEREKRSTHQGVFGVVVAIVVGTARIVAVTVMLVMVMTMFSMTLHQPHSLSRLTTRPRTLLFKKNKGRAEQPKTIRLLWLVGRRSPFRPLIAQRVGRERRCSRVRASAMQARRKHRGRGGSADTDTEVAKSSARSRRLQNQSASR